MLNGGGGDQSISQLHGSGDARSAAVGDEARPRNHDRLADLNWVGSPGERKGVSAAGPDFVVARVEYTYLQLADRDHRHRDPVRQESKGPAVLTSDKDRGVEKPQRHGSSSSSVCPAIPSSSAVKAGSADRSASSSCRWAPFSQRARFPWGTMSAVGSPLTVRITRSPALTASITRAVRLRSSRTPISMCD